MEGDRVLDGAGEAECHSGSLSGPEAETDEMVVDFSGRQAAWLVAKHRFWIARQLAGINRRFRIAIERLAADMFTLERACR